jgi:hypothetical protein
MEADLIPTRSGGRSLESRDVSASAVSSLKTIFSILMGLSVTNTLVILLRGGKHGQVHRVSAMPAEQLIFAGVLLFTIVRFYLGNVRHVDDVYETKGLAHPIIRPPNQRARRFVIDFAVLLVEALMFGLASFYVGRPSDLLAIMIALLTVDICWNRATQGYSPHQQVWFLNNFGHALAIGVSYVVYLRSSPPATAPLYVGIGLLLSNGLVDFVFSRAFYFAARTTGKSAFLSAPFTALLDAHDGRYPQSERQTIETIYDRLTARGWTIHNAHRRERWGDSIDTPYSALVKDLEAIDDSEQLVAIVGDPPSPGVQLEIGFALARGKRILVICGRPGGLPYLMRGVIEHESATFISSEQHGDDHRLAELVVEHLEERYTPG